MGIDPDLNLGFNLGFTAADLAVWDAALRQVEPEPPRPRRWSSPLSMAQDLDPTLVRTDALNLIDQALVDVADGREDRLLVSMPPQEAKSSTVAYRYPEWLLSQVNPNLRIILISYSDEVARRWGADVKRDFEMFNGDDGAVDLGVRLRADSRAAGRWQVEGHQGGMFCAGVAGSVTGRPADCLSGATEVVTPSGYIQIRDICTGGAPLPLVLSFNHTTGQAEWRQVIATRTIADRPLVEVCTAAGRIIRCTPDHRIHTAGRGYVPAVDLRPGDRLVVADQGADHLRPVRDTVRAAPVVCAAAEAGDAVVLRQGMPDRLGGRDVDVSRVRQGVHKEARRRDEVGAVRPLLLHETMLPGHGGQGSASACSGGAGDSGERRPSRVDPVGGYPESLWPSSVLQRRREGAVGWQEPSEALRRVRHRPEVEGGDLPEVLQRRPRSHLHDNAVLVLCSRVRDDAGRAREAGPEGADEVLLLSRVRRQVVQGVGPSLLELRQADRLQGSGPPVLLEGVPSRGEPRRQGPHLSSMRAAVFPEVFPRPVLRPGVRGCRPFGADGWHGQFPLQNRHELRRALPPDEATHHRAGRQAMPGVLGTRQDGADRPEDRCAHEVPLRDPPPERDPVGQPAREPDPAVLDMPCDTPQVSFDTVSVVREVHGVRDTVYDIQVDGNSNFFADEVLVHNCILIDDPIKDLEQAQSPVYRERFQRFWQGVAVPRLGPGAKVVLVSTRWHEADAAGWLLEHEGDRAHGGRWRVINIPAISEGSGDPLGRPEGVPMRSARGDRDWAAIRASVGEYVWAALYQGRPAPAEGGLFKRLWWRYWRPVPASMAGERIDLAGRAIPLADCWRFATVDLAASTRTSADWTVVSAWALTLDGDLVLLDRARARVGEAEHFLLVRPLAERWRLDTTFVERSQFGTTLAAEAARSGVHLTPLTADTDKFTRALPASARCSGGRVWLPAGASWLEEFVGEHSAFPNGSHDDQVDTLSYAVRVAVTKPMPVPDVRHRPAAAEVDFMTVAF